ncbi:MAG: hypothetical protein P8010_10920 [Desulfosarcinaceae bacterium]
MLEQIGPAKTLKVRQRVESVLPASGPARRVGSPYGAGPLAVTPAPETAPSSERALPEASPPMLPADTRDPLPEGGTRPLSGERTDVEPPQAEAIPPVVMEELTYQLPGGFRAEIRSEAIHRLYLEVGGEALLLVDGRLDPKGGGWFEEFKDLFLFTRRLALHRHLAVKGVDLAVASLGLWEERPVYVLGARFPDAAPNQIWVDKETLLPLRWLWQTAPDKRGGSGVAGAPRETRTFEIRYDRWQLFGKRRYPLRVRFFENHELVRTLFAEAVSVNPEVDASLMDLAALRETALPPAEADSPAKEGGDSEVGEIQEAIDIFKKRFE